MDLPSTETPYTEKQSIFKSSCFYLVAAILVCIIAFLFWHLASLNNAPSSFPIGENIIIEEGATVKDVSDEFKAAHLVQSSLYFYLILQIHFEDLFIQAGTYRFDTELTARELGDAITSGNYILPPNSVTFPEGFKVKDMAKYLPSSYADENMEEYTSYEGYLFPDTYFIKSDAPLSEIIVTMRENYNKRTESLRDRIANSPLTEKEIVILASIIEREGNDAQSMGMISGILHKRLEIGMPLQVDATLDYLLDKASHELTAEDLEIDSTYNTYMYKGLPPAPISNPGLVALEAVLNPIDSPYLYYLTGEDGNFYYAKTFEDHKQNKIRYLR